MRLVTFAGQMGHLLVLGLFSEPVAASPQGPDTLRIDTVVEAVRSANPSLRAARLGAAAAGERVSQAGALPDPMLSLGLMNRPVDDFGPDHAMTMNNIQWSQRFPWPGKRRLSREGSSHLAEAEVLDAAETEGVLIARAKSVYYRIAQVDRAIEVMESTRSLLRDFSGVATSQYAVGSGLQQDILQAQVAVAQSTADLMVLAETRSAQAARLNALMGRLTMEAIGALELPNPGPQLPTVEALLAEAVDRRPALLGAHRRVMAAEAALRVAERQSYPDLTITVGYGQRPRFDDLATVMVGASLPLWSESKQKPLRREMETLRGVQEARAGDLHAQTFAGLTELRAQAERARSLSELYRTSILPQALAAVESALSAYRVGNVDYMTLLSNQMTANRFQLESLELAADYHTAVAEIEALTGLSEGDES